LTPTGESSTETSNITRKKERKKLKATSRGIERNQIVQFLPILIHVEDN